MEKLSNRMSGILKSQVSGNSNVIVDETIAREAQAAANEKRALQEEQIMEELRAALAKENIYTGAGVREFTMKFVTKRRKELQQEDDEVNSNTSSIEKNQPPSAAGEEPKIQEQQRHSLMGRIGNALQFPGSSSAPAPQEEEEGDINILASTGALSGKEHDSSVFHYHHSMHLTETDLSGESSQNIDFDQSTSTLICGFGKNKQDSSSALGSSHMLKTFIKEDVLEEEDDEDSIASLDFDNDKNGGKHQASVNSCDASMSSTDMQYSGNNLICGFNQKKSG